MAICAKLISLDSAEGKKDVLAIELNKYLTIGRIRSLCHYVIPSTLISIQHCKVYAVASGCGGVIVSCRNMSTNGFWLNEYHIKSRCSVILMDGDVVKFPSGKAFQCIHLSKTHQEKSHMFEPTPPVKPNRMVFGNYTILSHNLGSGAFATVHLAMDTSKHQQLACKVLKVKESKKDLLSLLKEVRILAKLQHPNINGVVDIVHPSQESPFLKIFLQLCTGGDLFSFVVSHTDANMLMNPREVQFITYQILLALQYLHELDICHRDIKPENILLFTPGHFPRIQLADFGLARTKAFESTMNACGTVSYLPPEGILALDRPAYKYVGKPSDCWSTGLTVYIMLTGRHPFDVRGKTVSDLLDPEYSDVDYEDETIGQLSQRTARPEQASDYGYYGADDRSKALILNGGEIDFNPKVWMQIPEARVLVQSLTTHDYRYRATIPEALESDWIAGNLANLEALYKDRLLD